MHETPPAPPATPPALPPGPWRMERVISGAICVTDAERQTLVFVARDPAVPAATQIAIARAVAATPALLEACLQVRRALAASAWASGWASVPEARAWLEVRAWLDAAIAAATEAP